MFAAKQYFRTLLKIACTTSSAERLFSSLRRLKNYTRGQQFVLRDWMGCVRFTFTGGTH